MLIQKMTRCLSLLTLTCMVLTAEAALTTRSQYCSNVLRQTETQEKDCEGAARYYSGGDSNSAIMPLLCCLGVFSPNFPVSYLYKDHLDLSLISYIYKEVKTFDEEERVAVYTAQCYLRVKAKSPPLLTVGDYRCWIGSGLQLCQC